MRKALVQARDAGISVGAHPGFPDLLGFGRRSLPVSVQDGIDYTVYQVGALQAIAATEGVSLSHVKPHGAFYFAIASSPELATGIAAALSQLGGLPLLLCPSPGADAVDAAGYSLVRENAVDLEFDEAGRNIIEPQPQPKDPERVAEQAVRMAFGTAMTVEGTEVAMPVRSICIHGDRPNAAQIAKAVRRQLESSGVTVESVFPLGSR